MKIIFAVNLLIYGMFLSGMLILEADNFKALGRAIRLRHRLSTGKTGPPSPMLKAGYASAALFTLCFIASVCNFSFSLSVIISLLCALLPPLGVAVRQLSLRNKAGREGVAAVTEVYRQYRMNGCNIYQAIEAASVSSGNFPVCKKHLYMLLLRLRDAGNPQAVKSATGAFARGINSMWGRMLASSIEIAVLKGADVSAGLADIIEQLNTATTLMEERKRLNSESMRMTVFLVPFLYVGTMAVALLYLGVSPAKLLKNQFATPEGLLFLTVTVFLFMVNLLVLHLVDNAKIDY